MSTPATIIVKPCSMYGFTASAVRPKIPMGRFAPKARRPHARDGVADLGMIDGAWAAEACRQIVRTDQHAVDAVDAHDLLDVRDGIAMFGLDDDGGVVVGGLHILANAQAVAVGAGDAKSTLTRWRVLRRLHDPLRVLDRVDLRRNDAGRADVERAS